MVLSCGCCCKLRHLLGLPRAAPIPRLMAECNLLLFLWFAHQAGHTSTVHETFRLSTDGEAPAAQLLSAQLAASVLPGVLRAGAGTAPCSTWCQQLRLAPAAGSAGAALPGQAASAGSGSSQGPAAAASSAQRKISTGEALGVDLDVTSFTALAETAITRSYYTKVGAACSKKLLSGRSS